MTFQQSQPGPPVAVPPSDIRTKGVAPGLTDSSVAFAWSLTDAKNSSAAIPFGLAPDPHSTVVIDIPAGVWTVTQVNAMIGSEGMTAKSVGLKIRGAGLGLTSIVFNPASGSALNVNDYWLGVQFEGIDFYANVAGCTFMFSNTSHNAQRYSFSHCSFTNFKYVIDLQGTDNNSEFIFLYCHATGIASKETDQSAGAFFHIGASNTSDQFLNYWFYGCTHWSSSAPFIDAAMGGSFHIFGLDCSNWGTALTGSSANPALFNLRGYNHAYGVQNFQANGVRVEAKSASAALLYSEWPGGNVAFRNVDWSSQSGVYTYGNIITINYQNTDGALYSFEDSVLAGGVAVGFAVNDWQHRHAIAFTNCQWLQKTSPSDVVTYNLPATNTQTLPPVAFIRCRGTQNDATVAAGAVAWDATIGYNGDTLQTLQKREVSLRGVYGLPSGSTVVYGRLPIGALITSIQVLSPAGAVTATNTNGSWTLATTDATPVTVGTVSVTTAQNAGFSVETVLSVPFRCSTSAKATLSLTPANISQDNSQGLFVIKGYW